VTTKFFKNNFLYVKTREGKFIVFEKLDFFLAIIKERRYYIIFILFININFILLLMINEFRIGNDPLHRAALGDGKLSSQDKVCSQQFIKRLYLSKYQFCTHL
jgi:hypothetical protein